MLVCVSSEEMREPTFLLLSALADGRQHGYSLLRAVATLSRGRVRLRPGSLYGALDRLVREGLVEEAGTEVVDGRHRRYYDLTEAGVQALTGHAQRLQDNASVATAALRRRATRPGQGRAVGVTGGRA
jgi:PadR family transcriptional regulator, regulatory protein PadR